MASFRLAVAFSIAAAATHAQSRQRHSAHPPHRRRHDNQDSIESESIYVLRGCIAYSQVCRAREQRIRRGCGCSRSDQRCLAPLAAHHAQDRLPRSHQDRSVCSDAPIERIQRIEQCDRIAEGGCHASDHRRVAALASSHDAAGDSTEPTHTRQCEHALLAQCTTLHHHRRAQANVASDFAHRRDE